MSTTIKTWYDFVLQQMAAESYFHEADKFGGLLSQKQVLMFGSNNPSLYSELDPVTLPILPGATRLTPTQATDFLTRYTILSHLPNTASGFSATLMEKLNDSGSPTGEYTLAMRSTEYANPAEGGDWDRDGINGADGEIFTYGFAFGQIASMESYYEHLKLGESFNTVSGLWESDTNLNGFKAKFGGATKAPDAVLNVSGYSLSGQLADVFTLLHPEVDQATVINGTGMGNIAPGKTLAQMVADFRQQLADNNKLNDHVEIPNIIPRSIIQYHSGSLHCQMKRWVVANWAWYSRNKFWVWTTCTTACGIQILN